MKILINLTRQPEINTLTKNIDLSAMSSSFD